MKYFSESSIKEEEKLFENFVCDKDFCVVGFYDGACKALEYTSTCRGRIDKLQLILPLFDIDDSYIYKKLESIKKRGIEIEVYLGTEDKTINSLYLEEFFKEFATIYYIKNKGYMS